MRLAPLLLAGSLVFAAASLAGNPPDPVETHVVSTGKAPCGTAAARGALWVGVYEAGTLLRLDANDGRITRRISVGAWPCRVALEKDAAWVTRDRAGELVRVDLRTGGLRRFAVGSSPFDVTVAFGSVWVTSFDVGTVARFDARTQRMTRVYKLSSNAAGLTRCGGRIWVGHGSSATRLSAIDPSTHRIQRIRVGTRAPGWPRCIRGELWVTAPKTVLRIDPRRGKVLARLRLGGSPAEAALGPDALVWVTDKERSLVHRIYGPRARVVNSFQAGPGAFALARAGAAMWITSFAGADIRRYDP